MQVKARNGTVWKNITDAPGLESASSSNVFSERPGPTSYCHICVVYGSPYRAFHLFIDEKSINQFIIILCTSQCYVKRNIALARGDDRDDHTVF